MVKAVCFDLDGVFFTSSGFSDFKNKVMSLGADPEKVNFYFHKEPMEKFKLNLISESDYFKEAVNYLNLNVSPAKLINLLPLGYKINLEVLNYIKSLKSKGIKTCVCSNNFVTRVNLLQKKFNFLQYFDVAVFSYEVGFLKPDQQIFKELLIRLAVLPEQVVYSDDSEEKLRGAKDLGINTLVYTNFEDFKTTLINFGVN